MAMLVYASLVERLRSTEGKPSAQSPGQREEKAQGTDKPSSESTNPYSTPYPPVQHPVPRSWVLLRLKGKRLSVTGGGGGMSLRGLEDSAVLGAGWDPFLAQMFLP